MTLFKEATNTMAFAKVGLLGFAGSGKTRTAWEIAQGLHKAIGSIRPIGMMDTETGADFLIPLAKEAGIKFFVSKTRAFKDLTDGIKEAENLVDILIIDSVSHYWVDLVESYRKKKNVNRLAFQDWGIIKPQWAEFSTWYVTSKVHCIIAGRAGFEYDYFEGDDGKMELYKTGTKMKAEGEFGFEPSLLIEMERIKNPDATEQYHKSKTKTDKEKAVKAIREERQWVRRAFVLKDRADILDGKFFDNPTFTDFAPHWQYLNIGGEHHPVTLGDSQSLFNVEGKPNWKVEQEMKDLNRAEIKALVEKYFPGSAVKEKTARILLKEHVFCVRSDEGLESVSLDILKEGKDYLEWLLPHNGVIEALLSGQDTMKFLDTMKKEWEVYQGNAATP